MEGSTFLEEIFRLKGVTAYVGSPIYGSGANLIKKLVDISLRNFLKNMEKLQANYDLLDYAPAWNIYEFITGARIYADLNHHKKIHLNIVKRPLAEALIRQPQTVSEYTYRIQDILVGAVPMFPISSFSLKKASELENKVCDFPPEMTESRSHDINRARYFLQPFLKDNYESGKLLPSIKIPKKPFELVSKFKQSIGTRKLVTVTLRAATFLGEKNSNMLVWDRVIHDLRAWGAHVLVIPDIETVNLNEDISPIAMSCLFDQRLRAALYDVSDLNLAVSNGANAPMFFNANSCFLIAKLFTEGTNTSRNETQRLVGDLHGGSWMGVPWQRTLEGEDANEIVSASLELLTTKFQQPNHDELDLFFTAPSGRPDASATQLRNFWACVNPVSSKLSNSHRKSIILEMLSETSQFHNAKSLIVRSLKAFLDKNFQDSISLSKQALMLEERYIDPYLLIGLSLSSAGRRTEGQQWLSGAKGRSLFFYRSKTPFNKFEIKNFL